MRRELGSTFDVVHVGGDEGSAATFEALLAGLRRREVETVVLVEVEEPRDLAHALEGRLGTRTISLIWDALPTVKQAVDGMARALAAAAFRLHPDWAHPSASLAGALHWREAAAKLVARGELPLPVGDPEVDVPHLVSLLTPPITFVLGTDGAACASRDLVSLVTAAEWLVGRHAGTTIVAVPPALRGEPALERIAYRSFSLCDTEDAREVATPTQPRKHLDSERHGATSRPPPTAWHRRTHTRIRGAAAEGEPELSSGFSASRYDVRVGPLEGRPHPASPGEHALYHALEADPELAGVFAPNTRVSTTTGASYVVDLRGELERLVVEVDGYAAHAGRFRFAFDRQKDFALLVSGWVVLRLTHDEVMASPANAVEKVRTVVRLRRNSP